MKESIKITAKSACKSLILALGLLATSVSAIAQTYPFTLPATVTATLDVNTQKKEVANDKLLGANIGGFTSTDEQTLVKKFDPVTIRFPSGVFINWYDWTIDSYRIYDDYVPKNYKGEPDSSMIKLVYNSRFSKAGFPGLTALNNQKKAINGKGYSMLFGYNLNYDDNKKSAARLRDSEQKGFSVDYVEMGNEQFYGNQRSNATSTPQKYVVIAKSLSDTLHKIKPSIQMSVPLSWRTTSGNYNDILTADQSYFDAVSIHKYVGSDPDVPASFTYGDVLGGRTLLESDVNYARKLAPTKPVWLTEWGVSAGSDFQAAAGLGMADCYLFLYENQKIYGRADWYCVNGLLNSFISFVGTSRNIKYPLERTGYGAVHKILRSVFENSTLLDGTMTTTKFTNAKGTSNVVNARVVEKDGKKLVFAVNLANKPVVFTIKFDGTPMTQTFKHEALVFNTLSDDYVIPFDDDPLKLIKEGSGAITLPALSVNKITLNDVTTAINVKPIYLKELIVYPNPSDNGIFTLSKSGSWKVYNINGQLKLTGKGNQVDLSKVGQGTYILAMGTETTKLVYK